MMKKTLFTFFIFICSQLSALEWSVPHELDIKRDDKNISFIQMDCYGCGYALWQDDYRGAVSFSKQTSGKWDSPILVVVEDEVLVDFALNKEGEGIALFITETGVAVRTLSKEGEWSFRKNLCTTNRKIFSGKVAINAAGDATAVWEIVSEKWILFDSDKHDVYCTVIEASTCMYGKWSKPVCLSYKQGFASLPSVVVNDSGESVCIWVESALSETFFGVYFYKLVQAATFSEEGWESSILREEIEWESYFSSFDTRKICLPKIALNSQGDAIAVWAISTIKLNSSECTFIDSFLETAVLNNGYWSPAEKLTEKKEKKGIFSLQLAANDFDRAACIWSEWDNTKEEVHAVIQTDNNWSSPINFSSSEECSSDCGTVGVDQEGNGICAWLEEGKLVTATFSHEGILSTPQRVNSQEENVDWFQLVVNDAGKAMILWEQPIQNDSFSLKVSEASLNE